MFISQADRSRDPSMEGILFQEDSKEKRIVLTIANPKAVKDPEIELLSQKLSDRETNSKVKFIIEVPSVPEKSTLGERNLGMVALTCYEHTKNQVRIRFKDTGREARVRFK